MMVMMPVMEALKAHLCFKSSVQAGGSQLLLKGLRIDAPDALS